MTRQPMAVEPGLVAATTRKSVDVDGARIAYSDAGPGKPVMMIHCSAASGGQWHPLGETLGYRFRAIAPDQWSCGESDSWPGHAPFTLAAEAAPVLRIMDALAEPVHLVGHSYGGAAALEVACERPDALLSLTLIEPSAFHVLRQGGRADMERFYEISTVSAAVNDAVLSGGYRGGMGRFVDYWNGSGAWDITPERARIKLSARLPKVALDFRALFHEKTELSLYGQIGVPTLILCGDASPAPSRRIVEMLAANMPCSRVEAIPGAGHMSPFTHVHVVNRHVCGHLDALTSAAPMAA